MKQWRQQWPILFIGIILVVIFRKFFFYGLLPIPYNIMVAWYFPYNLGGWEAYTQIIPHKGGLFAADVFRQMIPWKQLSLEIIRAGELPLWNPYAFSGEPLLANIQTTILHPLSILFLVISNFDLAWSLYIIAAPLISLGGMYLWSRTLGWKQISSLVAGIAFTFSGHMLAWLEWGVVSHTAIWLPWILYGLHQFWISNKTPYLLLLILSVYATVLGGYPQQAAFVLLISFIYFGVLLWQNSYPRPVLISKLSRLIVAGVITVGLCLPQLASTYQLYQLSALKGETSQALFMRTRLHPFHLVNFFASDYFGNRIYSNYWADILDQVDYPDAAVFVGSVSAIFVLASVLRKRRNHIEWFGLDLVILGLIIAIDSPISDVIGKVSIPMISTGVAAGSLFVTTFGLATLAGSGVERVLKRQLSKHQQAAIVAILGLFISSWLVVPVEYQRVAVRNSILPITVMVATIVIIGIYLRWYKVKLVRVFLGISLLILILGEITVYSHKLLSFSPPAYSYPEHFLISQLKQLAGYDRVAGFWETKLSTNLPTAWRLYAAEGYNPLHVRAYQELSSGQKYLGYPPNIARSDADIYPDEIAGRNRFMQLTSTKYISAKVVSPHNDWEVEPLKYDPELFELIWQEGVFKIYRYIHALERVKLYNQYQVISDPVDRVNHLYSSDFDPNQTVVIQKPLDLELAPEATGSAAIVEYQPNLVKIETFVENGPMLLLLTDTFYPSWQVKINGAPAEIYQANHAFRAVLVPSGQSSVEYKISWP